MSSSRNGGNSLQRALLLGLGLGLGVVVGVILYQELKRRQEEETSGPTEKALIRPPAQAITIPPPSRTREIALKREERRDIQPAVLPLSIEAIPAKFRRGEPGTIRVRTLPDATCAIEAVYSTGRRPTGLDTGPITAGENGECEWTWGIGTSGTYVDVTIQGWLEGYENAEETLRVPISD